MYFSGFRKISATFLCLTNSPFLCPPRSSWQTESRPYQCRKYMTEYKYTIINENSSNNFLRVNQFFWVWILGHSIFLGWNFWVILFFWVWIFGSFYFSGFEFWVLLFFWVWILGPSIFLGLNFGLFYFFGLEFLGDSIFWVIRFYYIFLSLFSDEHPCQRSARVPPPLLWATSRWSTKLVQILLVVIQVSFLKPDITSLNFVKTNIVWFAICLDIVNREIH